MARAYPQRLGAIVAGLIDPKPAEYHGIAMRSHLEADFARHLDDRGIAWRYEPAIFGPRGSGYLPDFELRRPDGRHYVEVKPTLREVPEAQRRMAVIWATYPDAVLVVVCAQDSRWYASPAGAEWVSWVERWAHQ
jgi:hypothetical protein